MFATSATDTLRERIDELGSWFHNRRRPIRGRLAIASCTVVTVSLASVAASTSCYSLACRVTCVIRCWHLDLIRSHVAGNLLVCQSLQRGSPELAAVAEDYPFEETLAFFAQGAPRMQFIEHRIAGDPTSWWVPNAPCMQAMLPSAGYRGECRKGTASGCMAGSTAAAAIPTVVAHSDPGWCGGAVALRRSRSSSPSMMEGQAACLPSPIG